MIRPSFALALFIIGFYSLLNIMASDENKDKQEVLLDMGGQKVPFSQISQPHNVVVGGANKPVPNLDNFPSLEPWAQGQEQDEPKKEGKQTEESQEHKD